MFERLTAQAGVGLLLLAIGKTAAAATVFMNSRRVVSIFWPPFAWINPAHEHAHSIRNEDQGTDITG